MALGAVIGQAIGHKRLGNKAALYGAIGGLLPDADTLATPYLGTYAEWLYHRHITHSVLFAPIVAPLLGWLSWAFHRKIPGHYKYYLWIWLCAILTHPLLDTLTIYGTQLLAPFSTQRFYISAVSIIDPVYTLILFMALALPIVPRWQSYAPRIAGVALILSTLFLGYGAYLNDKAERLAAAQLREQNITPARLNVYTTIFQPFLRRVVVHETIEGHDWLRAGFVSTWNPRPIAWSCLEQNGRLHKQAILQTEGGRVFHWFTGGELSYRRENDRVIVMDARYGTPGPSVFGFWGLVFTMEGGVIDTARRPAYIRAPREVTGEAIFQLFRAAFGLPNHFLPTRDTGCP